MVEINLQSRVIGSTSDYTSAGRWNRKAFSDGLSQDGELLRSILFMRGESNDLLSLFFKFGSLSIELIQLGVGDVAESLSIYCLLMP